MLWYPKLIAVSGRFGIQTDIPDTRIQVLGDAALLVPRDDDRALSEGLARLLDDDAPLAKSADARQSSNGQSEQADREEELQPA